MSRLKIAQLSDSHFGTIYPHVREALLRTLADLKPDLVLFTGDITQRARGWQFREAREFTRKLKPASLIAVPGNHDIPLFNIFLRLFDPYRGFKRLFKDQLEKDFHHGDVLITGLNSTDRWRHIQGQFDLDRLQRRLSSSNVAAKVHIAAFHHPMDCLRPQDEKNLLRKSHETISIFDRHKVDLVVGGHIHDPYVTLSKPRYPHTNRNMVIAVAGTCTSWRTRKGAPNSFNCIDVDTTADARLTISRYDLRSGVRFEVEHVHHFSRDPDLSWRPG
jgi:3',5'-cyclic AMP phosphodiesterase CpdA